MTIKRDQYIGTLVRDLKPIRVVSQPKRSALMWFLGALLAAAFFAWLKGPFREDSFEQLTTSWQFAIESGLGLLAIASLIYAAFDLAIPSSENVWLRTLTPLVVVALWVSFFVIGLSSPALSPSMVGKRELCFVQTALYSLPLMCAAMYWVKRQWPVYTLRTGLFVGMAAGLTPAWLMQFACMYLPNHILSHHILPGLSMGIVGALIGAYYLPRR